jgi:hypothetical protein
VASLGFTGIDFLTFRRLLNEFPGSREFISLELRMGFYVKECVSRYVKGGFC